MRRRFVFTCLMAFALASPAARANITDLLSRLGRPVPSAPRTLKESQPRQLLLNGFALHVMSGRTPEGVDAVLDFYARQFSHEEPGRPQPPMQRQRGRDFGSIVAVDAPLQDTLKRLQSDRLHWALSAPLRMSYAHRAGDYTDYLAVWSDHALPDYVLRPPIDSDAPGADIPDTPRPPGSRRSFNVQEPESGYRVVTYLVDAPPVVGLELALATLQDAGYHLDASFQAATRRRGKLLLRLERPGRDLVVSAQAEKREPGGGKSQVTYLSRER